MNRRVLLAAAALCAVAGCRAQRAVDAATPLAATLRDFDGGDVTLEHWRGRTLVLNVWASWCAPCRAEMASLQALSERIDPARGAVIGVTVDDDLNLVREYLRRGDIRFRNLLAGSAQAARDQLGVRALPETLIVSPEGSLRKRIQGARDWNDASLLAQLAIPLRVAAAVPSERRDG